MKSTCTQGCSSLPSEVRISPRQEGGVQGQEIGTKAWRHELGCQGLDCVHSLLDVSVALILNKFSFLCLCLFCKEFLIQHFIYFFFQLLQKRISMQLEREDTHVHTHVLAHILLSLLLRVNSPSLPVTLPFSCEDNTETL